MNVVALRAVRDPLQRQVRVFCVQAYWRDRAGLAKGKFQQFSSQEAALRAGKVASAKAAGVLVYAMQGYVGTDVWSEPHVIARHGETPRI